MTDRDRQVAVSVVGADRPGIVAAVAAQLVAQDANVEDSAMTLLRGRFAMVLVVGLPAGSEPAALEAALSARLAPMSLVVHVEDLAPTGSAPSAGSAGGTDGERWALSVHGADRPGIVAAVTEVLARHGVNIVGLTSRVVGAGDDVYVLLLELELAPGIDAGAVRAELEAVAAGLGVAWRLHPSDGDVL